MDSQDSPRQHHTMEQSYPSNNEAPPSPLQMHCYPPAILAHSSLGLHSYPVMDSNQATDSMKDMKHGGRGTVTTSKSSKAGTTIMNGGRWTDQEHQCFLAGLRQYGREWKKVASKIKTRTSAQIRSHAQKYFAKLARDQELRKQLNEPDDELHYTPTSFHTTYSSDGSSDGGRKKSEQSLSTGSTSPTPDELAAFEAYNMPNPRFDGKRTQKRSRYTGKQEQRKARRQDWTSMDRHMEPKKAAMLPSQQELMERASPNIRHRVSSLIDSELCALQVLSSYASLPVTSMDLRLGDEMDIPRSFGMVDTDKMTTSSQRQSIY